ncbi:hypothetical protein COO60DRAFT_1554506 [Scenedesmus sp. NREL 46B-D3]|nr:hypothetical protein COO60DRAFT_1554506 [Scenedesmus sp. NREL 46B-D3]
MQCGGRFVSNGGRPSRPGLLVCVAMLAVSVWATTQVFPQVFDAGFSFCGACAQPTLRSCKAWQASQLPSCWPAASSMRASRCVQRGVPVSVWCLTKALLQAVVFHQVPCVFLGHVSCDTVWGCGLHDRGCVAQ